MLTQFDKDHLPTLNDTKRMTMIQLEGKMANDAINRIGKQLHDNFTFVPPIFEEYVVVTDDSDMILTAIEEEYCTSKMSADKKAKVISKQLAALRKKFRNFDDLTHHYIYVKWLSDTSFSLVFFEAGKKRLYITVQYIYDQQGQMSCDADVDVLSNIYKDAYLKDDLTDLAYGVILLVMFASDYLLNYTDKVEYVLDDNNEPFKKPKKDIKPADTDKKQNDTQFTTVGNAEHKEDNQAEQDKKTKVYYKSKIKLYEISVDDVLNYKKRKYRKIKQSWFVRGYYQRFGKAKIPRYIPPRINYRHGITTPPKIGNLYELDIQTDADNN